MAIELRILGPLRLGSPDRRELDPLLRQSKRVALLAYLGAATPHGFHRRDTLLAIFWPELDASRARSALSQALYVLRSALGNHALITRGDADVGVAPEALWCDAAAFEQALDEGRPADALALYRGDLLDGFYIQDAPEFERWLDVERSRLRHRAAEGAWALAEHHAGAGQTVEAVRWGRRAADLLPADEAVVRRLMTFLYRLGDRAAAIRAYEAFVWRLGAEYELQPSGETVQLADAIRHETASSHLAIRLERLLPPPFPRVLHRIERSIPVRWTVTAVLALIVFASGALLRGGRSEPPPRPILRFVLRAPDITVVTGGVAGSTIAISPANDYIAFLAATTEGTKLVLRSTSELTTATVPHTLDAYLPFFSADGKWLAFVQAGAIRKIPLGGGPAITICDAATSIFGASWGPNDIIVFATAEALWQVNASGGPPRMLAMADTAAGIRYRWPEVLPNGRTAVFTRIDRVTSRLASITLATGSVRSLNVEGTHPHYVDPGYLVFARQEGALLTAPFDAGSLMLTGPAIQLMDGIVVGLLGAAKLGVSRAGALAYVPENLTSRALTMVDRGGRADTLPLPLQGYSTARLSPDARRIVAEVVDGSGSSRDIWLFDLERRTTQRLTTDRTSVYPSWSPDDARIAFTTTAGGRETGFSIRSTSVDGRATEVLIGAEHGQVAETFARDARSIIYHRETTATRRDIWILPLSGDRTPRPYLQTPFDERAAATSPDGRWLAYVSNENGHDDVFVRPFPNPDAPKRISDGGGREPRWSPDGRELFYRSDDGMVSVAVTTDARLETGRRHQLFDDDAFVTMENGTGYDVHPDGDRFLMIRRGAEAREIVVVLNMFEHLRSAAR